MARPRIRFLLRARPRHDVTGLHRTIALAEPILQGLGFGAGRVATIETDDPFALGESLRAIEDGAAAPRPASFQPVGGKRDVQRLALRELQRAAPSPVDVIALPAGAPFGKVEVNVEGCTLCLACVSACPTGALLADPERPMLALFRRRLRAMRIVPGHLPGKGHHAAAAARFPRRHRAGAGAQGRRAVLLHQLRQALWREKHD